MSDSDWIEVPETASTASNDSDWIEVPDTKSNQVSAVETKKEPSALSSILTGATKGLMTGGIGGAVAGGLGAVVSQSKEAREALPFANAPEAFQQGYKTGQDVLGENVAGKGLGTVFGGAMASGTAFNPVAKGAGYVPRLAQASGEAIGGQPGMAEDTLMGKSPILPGVAPKAYNTGHPDLDTALNLNSDLWDQIRKDPVNAAMLVEAARSPETMQALKTLPESIKVATWDKATKNTAAVNAKAILDSIGNFTVRNLDRVKTPAHENALMAAFDPPSGSWNATKKSVSNMATKLPELSEKYNAPMKTAKDMETLTQLGKKDLFEKYSEMSGQAPEVSLDPVYNAMIEVANNPANLLRNTEKSLKILEEANKYKGQKMPAAEAEDLLTKINAENNRILSENDRVSAATMENSNPNLKADIVAGKALQKALVEAISPEYGQLRKDYGDLSHLNQMASRKAIAQEKLTSKQNLYENLGVFGAIAKSGEPVKALTSLAAGKAMKIMGTPDFKFNKAAQMLENLPKGLEKGSAVEATMGDKVFHGQYVGNSGRNIKVNIQGRVKTFTPDQIKKSDFNAVSRIPDSEVPAYQIPTSP